MSLHNKTPYLFLAIATAALMLVLAIWFPNLSFIKGIISSSSLSFGQKWGILVASLAGLKTNFTPLSRSLAIANALLFGINLSFLIYYLRLRLTLARSMGTSLTGAIMGVVAGSCASCGSVILTSFFGLTTSASFISFLPLRGNEFGTISTLLLTFSIFLCPVIAGTWLYARSQSDKLLNDKVALHCEVARAALDRTKVTEFAFLRRGQFDHRFFTRLNYFIHSQFRNRKTV